ncbi:hypothetical protein FQN50_006674, partial [Emmonsiellopsis sp. PD_5]
DAIKKFTSLKIPRSLLAPPHFYCGDKKAQLAWGGGLPQEDWPARKLELGGEQHGLLGLDGSTIIPNPAPGTQRWESHKWRCDKGPLNPDCCTNCTKYGSACNDTQPVTSNRSIGGSNTELEEKLNQLLEMVVWIGQQQQAIVDIFSGNGHGGHLQPHNGEQHWGIQEQEISPAGLQPGPTAPEATSALPDHARGGYGTPEFHGTTPTFIGNPAAPFAEGAQNLSSFATGWANNTVPNTDSFAAVLSYFDTLFDGDGGLE